MVLAALIVVIGCQKTATRDPRRLRVVCLTPSTTEIVAALGALDTVVGVDNYSEFPAEVHALPRVGDFLNPSLEAILHLTPDIVLIDAVQTQVDAKLKDAGIRTLALPMQTIADVRNGALAIGRALDRERDAQAFVARLDGDLVAVEERGRRAAERLGRRPRVLFVVDRQIGGFAGMVAAGPDNYLDELVRRAGGDNVLADAPMRYVSLSVEQVIALAPEVILDATHVPGAADAGRARADWDRLSSVPAVQRGRVHVLADRAAVTPGPRLGDVLARLQRLIEGEG